MTEGSMDEDDWHAPPSSSSSSASWEIDWAYEFDASQFFDFSRPESSSDAERAERWFQVAGYDPPSHFYFKAKVKTTTTIPANHESPMVVKDDNDDHFTPSHHHHHHHHLSSSSNHDEKTTKGGRRRWNNSGHRERMEEEEEKTPSSKVVNKAKEKSVIKWGGSANNKNKERSGGGSTLMKPTASQLAKLNHVKHQRHNHEAIKRQKLDHGYFVSKGGSSSPVAKTSKRSKLNITVPKEPHLETQCRAQWRRFKSKNNLGSSICSSDNVTKEKSSASKVRPLNKKIPHVLPSTPETKKSIRRSPNSQKSKVSDEEKLLQQPPVELFSKLTLNSDTDNRAASHGKPHPFGNVNLNKLSPKK